MVLMTSVISFNVECNFVNSTTLLVTRVAYKLAACQIGRNVSRYMNPLVSCEAVLSKTAWHGSN